MWWKIRADQWEERNRDATRRPTTDTAGSNPADQSTAKGDNRRRHSLYRFLYLRDDVIGAVPGGGPMPATLDPEPMRTVIR